MFENLNKLILAGLGALSLTRDRAEKIFDEYVHRGQAAQADREGFVKDLMASAEKARKDLQETVEKHVQQAVAKLNLVTGEDLAHLEEKLDELLKRRG